MSASHRDLDDWLGRVRVDPAVFDLAPDYCAGLMAVQGLMSGPTDRDSDDALRSAEQLLLDETTTLESDAQIDRWRAAYRSFGANPNRTRPSPDALRRRAVRNGLPRVNRVTDHYNACSVVHGVPIGVEDIDRYDGVLRLVRAAGDETFEAIDHGEQVTETVDVGEPIWRDDAGVTCRRWNWRQTTRTALDDSTHAAIFIVDALGPDAISIIRRVLDDLRTMLDASAIVECRTIRRSSSHSGIAREFGVETT